MNAKKILSALAVATVALPGIASADLNETQFDGINAGQGQMVVEIASTDAEAAVESPVIVTPVSDRN